MTESPDARPLDDKPRQRDDIGMTSSCETSRQCGDCTLSCKIMEIEQLDKPAQTWCRHCRPRHGCAIYQTRPIECVDFRCLWLSNVQLDDSWKPSRAKLVLTMSADGVEVRCDPGFPEAWRRPPYEAQIREWARRGEDNDVTVLVIIGRRMILITPGQDFDLGEVGRDERIVREFEGTHVVGVRVVKADPARDA